MSNLIPGTSAQWLQEIERAIDDAREAVPFVDPLNGENADSNLFHLAPLVCLKFRGLDFRDEALRKKVTEGALATYIANSRDASDHELGRRPLLAFAVCYVSAHHCLDLIDETEAEGILELCDANLD